jgi:5-methylcytosine-specific restriction enzyme A
MPYLSKAYRRFRESDKWQRMKAAQLEAHPHCARCGSPATDCRHLVWCHDDEWFIHDPNNLESVCAQCKAIASAEDHRAYSRMVDADGYPIDPRHPALDGWNCSGCGVGSRAKSQDI